MGNASLEQMAHGGIGWPSKACQGRCITEPEQCLLCISRVRTWSQCMSLTNTHDEAEVRHHVYYGFQQLCSAVI